MTILIIIHRLGGTTMVLVAKSSWGISKFYVYQVAFQRLVLSWCLEIYQKSKPSQMPCSRLKTPGFPLRKWETIGFWGYLLLTPHKTCHGVACFCIRWNCVLSHAVTLFKSWISSFLGRYADHCWSFPDTSRDHTRFNLPFRGTMRYLKSRMPFSLTKTGASHIARPPGALRGPSGGPWERWQLRRFCAENTATCASNNSTLSADKIEMSHPLIDILIDVGLLLHF